MCFTMQVNLSPQTTCLDRPYFFMVNGVVFQDRCYCTTGCFATVSCQYSVHPLYIYLSLHSPPQAKISTVSHQLFVVISCSTRSRDFLQSVIPSPQRVLTCRLARSMAQNCSSLCGSNQSSHSRLCRVG